MKTTIDQAMTKVFQQRDRIIPRHEPSVDSSDSRSAQTEGDLTDLAPQRPVDPVELYVDPPQDGSHPARPDGLIPPAPAETTELQHPAQACDPVESSAECCATEPHSCDGMPAWSDCFIYQLSVHAPPTETVVPASAVAVTQTIQPEEVDESVEAELSHKATPDQTAQPADPPPQLSDEVSSPEPERVGTPEPDAGLDKPTLRPVWEVDCLGLPPICRQVVESVSVDLQRVCQHLSPATGGLRNLVSIDSFARGEGRTTVALALAHGLAQLGQKILLVDADFGHPSLANQLGLAIRQGWEHSVRDGLPIRECCIHSIGDGFTVLPLGSAGLATNDLRTLQRIQDILGELTQNFDRVLLDNGPGGHTWVALPPERLLAHLIVRNLRQTSASELQQMLDRIQHSDDVLVSRIDNFATPSDLAMAKSA